MGTIAMNGSEIPVHSVVRKSDYHKGNLKLAEINYDQVIEELK